MTSIIDKETEISLENFRRRVMRYTITEHDLMNRLVSICFRLKDCTHSTSGDFDVLARVKESIKSLGDTPVVIFAGGGLDSNVLISICSEVMDRTKIHVISCRTESNRREIQNLEWFCSELGVKYTPLAPSAEDLEREISFFRKSQGRLPKDIAQPMVSHMYRYTKSRHPNAAILDGQYADTFMYSNPQNIYFRTTQLISIIHSIRFFKTVQKVRFKAIRHFLFCFSSVEIKILYLCNICITDGSVRTVGRLIERSYAPKEVVLQVVFKEVLLFYRERDKYLTSSEIVSPFEMDNLFADCTRNMNKYCGFFRTKVPLRDYFRKMHPQFYIGTKSRSFK